MTAKTFLQKIYIMRTMLKTMEERIEDMHVKAQGIGAIRYDKDRVQVSPEDHMSETVAAIVELEEEYGRTIVDYHREILLRTKMIEQMEDPRYAALLTHRYIDCMRFEEIACAMNYSWQHVLRLHGEALDAFGEKYADQLK